MDLTQNNVIFPLRFGLKWRIHAGLGRWDTDLRTLRGRELPPGQRGMVPGSPSPRPVLGVLDPTLRPSSHLPPPTSRAELGPAWGEAPAGCMGLGWEGGLLWGCMAMAPAQAQAQAQPKLRPSPSSTPGPHLAQAQAPAQAQTPAQTQAQAQRKAQPRPKLR